MVLSGLKEFFNKKSSNETTQENRAVLNSYISNPELIDVDVKISNSNLHGKVQIGVRSIINDSFLMGGEIKIGRYTSINGPNTDIYCLLNPVIIGNFVSIARNVSIQEYNHVIDRCTTYFINEHIFNKSWLENDIESKGPINIGSDVWIGSHSVILSGVTVGHGAVIGANSVVTRDVPPYAVMGGSPARIIRYRFEPEIIDKLLELKWWEWSTERIKENKDLFNGKLTLEKLGRIK